MKIGYIDDQSRLLSLFKQAFSEHEIALITREFHLSDKKQIVESIIQENFDVILLDYHLSGSYKGRDLAQELIGVGCNATLIGFSTDPYTAPLFANVGVPLFIQKQPGNPGYSVEEVLGVMGTFPHTKHE